MVLSVAVMKFRLIKMMPSLDLYRTERCLSLPDLQFYQLHHNRLSSGMIPWLCLSVGCHFGPDWNGWVAMISAANIHGTNRINCNIFNDPFIFPRAPSTSIWTFPSASAVLYVVCYEERGKQHTCSMLTLAFFLKAPLIKKALMWLQTHGLVNGLFRY